MADIPGFFEIVSIEGPNPEDTYDILDLDTGIPIVTFDAHSMYSTAKASSTTYSSLRIGPSLTEIASGKATCPTVLDSRIYIYNAFGIGKATCSGILEIKKKYIRATVNAKAYFFDKIYTGPSIKVSAVAKATTIANIDATRQIKATANAKGSVNSFLILDLLSSGLIAGRATASGWILSYENFYGTAKAIADITGTHLDTKTDFYSTGTGRWTVPGRLSFKEPIGSSILTAKSNISGNLERRKTKTFTATLVSRVSTYGNPDTVEEIKGYITSKSVSLGIVDDYGWLMSTVTSRAMATGFPRSRTELAKILSCKAKLLSIIDYSTHRVLYATCVGKASSQSGKLLEKEILSGTVVSKALAPGAEIESRNQLEGTAKGEALLSSIFSSTAKITSTANAISQNTEAIIDISVFLTSTPTCVVYSSGVMHDREELSGTCVGKVHSETKWLKSLISTILPKATLYSYLDNNRKWFYSTVTAKSYNESSIDYKFFLNSTVIAGATSPSKLYRKIKLYPETVIAKGSSYGLILYRKDPESTVTAKAETTSEITPKFLIWSTATAKATNLSDFDRFLHLYTTSTAKADIYVKVIIPINSLKVTVSAKASTPTSFRPFYKMTGAVAAKAHTRGIYGPQMFVTSLGSSKCSAYLGTSLLRDLGRLWFELY